MENVVLTIHLILALLTLLPACSRSPGKAPSAQAEASPTTLVAAGGAPLVTSISGDVAGATSKEDQVVGAPKVLDNLTLFPITAKTQVDVGPLEHLERLGPVGDAGEAEVLAAQAVFDELAGRRLVVDEHDVPALAVGVHGRGSGRGRRRQRRRRHGLTG